MDAQNMVFASIAGNSVCKTDREIGFREVLWQRKKKERKDFY